MSRPLLQVENLSYAVDGKPIISGISFAMEEGETRAVIGPNGAGKSTLVRCLAGVITPTGGRVDIAGIDRNELSRRRLARSVCYIAQIQGDPPPFTVRDYVMMGRYAHASLWSGLSRGDIEKTDNALALAGIGHLADRTLPTLSGGERQLVEIACGLAQEAFLLIMDEPTTFLDPGRQTLLLSLMRRLGQERRLSILAVTHDINLAMLFTRKTLGLCAGRQAYDGYSRDLDKGDALRNIFGMDFMFLETGRGRRLAAPAGLLEADA